MKKDTHPQYYTDAKIICACGNIIKTGSAVKEMKVEICNACHPFYTGKKKILDTTGRVDRFRKMTEKAAEKKAAAKKANAEKIAKAKSAKKTSTKNKKNK